VAFLWGWYIWIAGTFSLGMLEVWEQLLVGEYIAQSQRSLTTFADHYSLQSVHHHITILSHLVVRLLSLSRLCSHSH
jgi:hypothetical protein